ncbi:MAG: glucose-6-phosphate isomerase [Opitutales bacterium]|nr:glucose-6-phosphate isomerase [Opitutales bacterium]
MWSDFKENYFSFDALKFAIDVSRVGFPKNYFEDKSAMLDKAFADMRSLEAGAIANPDENRMVGHYWLRAPQLAPTEALCEEIAKTTEAILSFAADVHSGKVSGTAGVFKNLLCVGIGGSALGPQFVASALGMPGKDKMAVYFLDNTDPDGMDAVFAALEGKLGETLTIVTSKSGSTPEPSNAMIETMARYRAAGLDFARHAVAVTGVGSQLDKKAVEEGFIARFPMWDWVGGRTSEMAAVGLLPAALQGLDIRLLLAGAAAMDCQTRVPAVKENPSALLALAWYYLTAGKGEKDMVILPYKDRLLLFARYLQQLIMESLGKEKDLAGNVVNQGISVYGNKGSTDQHAYVQQLREGVNNFFATFIEVLKDRETASVPVNADGATSGDFLEGFLLGTREALTEKGRASVTLTIESVDAASVGALIALFERAVGFYASFIGINAYHQPGVEAGKKAAASILKIQARMIEFLKACPGEKFTAEALAEKLNLENSVEIVFKLGMHLSASPTTSVTATPQTPAYNTTFFYK